MPRTRTQRIVFSILMAFAMVYGMELYNQALLAGGLRTELFAAPLADIVPLMAAVIALESLVGGRVAARHSACAGFGRIALESAPDGSSDSVATLKRKGPAGHGKPAGPKQGMCDEAELLVAGVCQVGRPLQAHGRRGP